MRKIVGKYSEYQRNYKKRWRQNPINREKEREYNRKNRHKWTHSNEWYKTPVGIWTRLGYGRKVNKTITKEDFLEWYLSQPRICVYCGIKESELFEDIFSQQYNKLQIDRKDNAKGYDKRNLVLACAVCNRTKSDIFTFEEMRNIGKLITNKRLGV